MWIEETNKIFTKPKTDIGTLGCFIDGNTGTKSFILTIKTLGKKKCSSSRKSIEKISLEIPTHPEFDKYQNHAVDQRKMHPYISDHQPMIKHHSHVFYRHRYHRHISSMQTIQFHSTLSPKSLTHSSPTVVLVACCLVLTIDVVSRPTPTDAVATIFSFSSSFFSSSTRELLSI